VRGINIRDQLLQSGTSRRRWAAGWEIGWQTYCRESAWPQAQPAGRCRWPWPKPTPPPPDEAECSWDL
jgi:hypothetical protein